MAQQIIFLGTVPGDKTGTKLRAGGDMINDNFTELYDLKVTLINAAGDTTHISAINTATGLTPETAIGIIFIEVGTGDLVYSNGTAWFHLPGAQIVLP